jgi:hypothetical protein
LNSRPPLLSLTPSPTPIPWTVWTGIIFAFTYMCIHYLCHLPSPAAITPFLLQPPPSPSPPGRTYFALLFSNFIEEKA